MDPAPASAPTPPEETLIWRGSPSQWTNFGTYFLCLLLAAGVAPLYLYSNLGQLSFAFLGVPALLLFLRWLFTRTVVYEVTNERIRLTTGLLTRVTTELELYRVRDYTVVRPFWLRLVGRGHLTLQTSDRTSPQVTLQAVPAVDALKDAIRAATERIRQRRGVRDLEIDSPDAH